MSEKSKKKRGLGFWLRIIIPLVILIMAVISIVVQRNNRPPEREIHKVQLGDFEKEVSANGEIQSVSESRVVSLVNSTVLKVFVEEGEAVSPGDLLLYLDKEDLELQIQNAENSLETARMSVRRELLEYRTAYEQALNASQSAQREVKRTQELHSIGSASDEALRLARDRAANASSQLNAARQQLNFREGRELDDDRTGPSEPDALIVENSLEVRNAKSREEALKKDEGDYLITSKIKGTVTSLPAKAGDFVTPGNLLVTVHDTQQLKVQAFIDEVDLSYLSPGQQVRISSDSFIGQELEGTVNFISPLIIRQGDARVCEIGVRIEDDPQGVARIGASCSLFVEVEKREQVPAIPVESYFIREGKKWVYLVKEQEGGSYFELHEQEIETGILGIETIEVTKGLQEGMRIIPNRLSALSSGMVIRVMEDPKDDD